MKIKIFPVFRMNKIRERSRSYVSDNLLKAISKYAEIFEPSLSFNKKERILILLRKLKDRILFNSTSFSIPEILANSKKIEKENGNDVLLTFSEIVTPKVSKTYIYQDLSVDYVARLYETKDPLLKYTPLNPMTDRKIVARRKNIQKIFYKNCAGIFTMSEWLANDLVEHTKIDKEKVHVVGGGDKYRCA